MLRSNKTFGLVIIISIIFFSCTNKNKVRIEGSISGISNEKLYLASFDLLTTRLIDSTELEKDGSFSFKVKSEGPQLYELMLSNKNFLLLAIHPGEKVLVRAKASDLSGTAFVSGSETAEQVLVLNKQLIKTRSILDSLVKVAFENKNKPDYDSLVKKLDIQYTDVVRAQRKFSIGFIISHLNSFASIVALYQQLEDNTYVLNENRDLQYVKLVSDTLKKYYPRSDLVKTLWDDRTRLFNEFQKLKLNSLTHYAVVKKYPEIQLPDISGDTIKLSSVNSKVVLLNYWSPQNEDCLYVQNSLNKLYSKYSKSGFEIYNVALYNNYSEWGGIVKRYGLAGYNVIDLSEGEFYSAKIYNVTKIPANFLIDPRSGILEKDIFGDNLESRLKELLQVKK